MSAKLVLWAVFGLVYLAPRTAVLAQQIDRRLNELAQVDRVVAVVGDRPIPYSRLEEEINVLRQQGRSIPEAPDELEAFQRQVLEAIVEDELLVQAAQRDTGIVVTDQEVQASADEAIREIRAQYASELEYQRGLREAGFTSPDEYRQWLAERKRRELLRNALEQALRDRQQLQPLPPTEAEMRAEFEEIKDQLPPRPATMNFRQIVIRTEADTAALLAAFARADSVVKMLRREEADFETLARQYSDDPGSRDRGGRLGWVRRGQGLVREFEQVAFRLRPNVISNPVRSPFGFHVIRVDRSEAAEVQVRHILISPEITEEDRERARRRAEEVAEALQAGASFDSLAAVHHNDREREIIMEDARVEALPQAYQDALQGAEEGDVLGPVAFTDRQRTKYAVILFQEARPAGPLTFVDIRDQLRTRLTQENAMRRFIEQLKAVTHIDIRL